MDEMTQTIKRIIANLHSLGSGVITIPHTNIVITRADFEMVAEGNTFEEILSCPADWGWVANRLVTIGLLKSSTDNPLDGGKLVSVKFLTGKPTKYLQAPNRIIMVVEHPTHWSVCDCANYGISTGAKIKWIQKCSTKADASLLARHWASSYCD